MLWSLTQQIPTMLFSITAATHRRAATSKISTEIHILKFRQAITVRQRLWAEAVTIRLKSQLHSQLSRTALRQAIISMSGLMTIAYRQADGRA